MGFACCRGYWDPQDGFIGSGCTSAESNESAGQLSFEVCSFDNRGTGESDMPLGAYTTSQLAKDCVAILEHVGWIQSASNADFHSGVKPAACCIGAPESDSDCANENGKRVETRVHIGKRTPCCNGSSCGCCIHRFHDNWLWRTVGWSLGGMVAQELTLMLMDRGVRPASLALACTHSGGWRLLPPLSSVPIILKVGRPSAVQCRAKS